jgi:hypothetical protein
LLKQEISRLEKIKGVKSNLKSEAPKPPQPSEVTKFHNDNINLKNQCKCQEIEIELLQQKINKLTMNIVGAPDEMKEER